MSGNPSSGRSARYQTSMGAMVGAMIVLVGAVLAFVLFRELFRENVETTPEAVDWESAVIGAQDSGLSPVHPPALPVGWIATSVVLTSEERPAWGMGMLTEDGRFVGLRQEDDSLSRLLETFVDEDAEEGEPVEVGGDLGGTWATYSDEGGDLALALERDEDVVLVYGSADQADLVAFASLLTEEPFQR